MPAPNPEQTASIASFAFYTFLDPIIWLGNRVPHLSHDQLPPLCDYDRLKNLIKRSYPVSMPLLYTNNTKYADLFVPAFGSVLRCTKTPFVLGARDGIRALSALPVRLSNSRGKNVDSVSLQRKLHVVYPVHIVVSRHYRYQPIVEVSLVV